MYRNRLAGPFSETVPTGLHKASDFDGVDRVSPLLRVIVDVFCGTTEDDCVTIVSNRFVDLVGFSFRKSLCKFWSEEDLSLLQKKLRCSNETQLLC